MPKRFAYALTTRKCDGIEYTFEKLYNLKNGVDLKDRERFEECMRALGL